MVGAGARKTHVVRNRLVVPSWAMGRNLHFVPGAVRCQSFNLETGARRFAVLKLLSPVLGYEGKDDDWKPKYQLRRCSSERSQAQIEPEVSANGNNQGRQNPEAG